MKQTREEFLKDPQPIIPSEDCTKEEQEYILSLIFRKPVKIVGDKFYVYNHDEKEKEK